MGVERRRRGLAGLVGLVLGATLVAPGGARAQAAPPGQPADEPVKTVAVTLVTGDVVRLSTYADGRQSAAIDRGPISGHKDFQTVQHDGDVFVFPEVAAPYIQSGKLDQRLFNVTQLAAKYAGDLPLILEYQTDTSNLKATESLLAQPVPNGARKVRNLASAGSVAVKVPGGRASTFWEAVDDDRPAVAAAKAAPVLDRKLKRIWLDARATASLDVSVLQIGAPAAWQAGFDGTGMTVAVLDTGIDPTHPDFAGRIAEMKNFSTTADAVDHNGHGTHVASTIAGTGAASGGKYKGVAPGARLLVGKVLGDDGSGADSGIIAGMEWAAAHARVVSMSLGGTATDGGDPMSEAVDRLSAQYGALFVIAAGNAGPSAGTLASPGTADSALTVGAVDKSDAMAGFSSRGPRLGNRAVKPEITAPGVNIAAAHAAGTFPGQIPADAKYVGMSGT